jgi:hypothetical protein
MCDWVAVAAFHRRMRAGCTPTATQSLAVVTQVLLSQRGGEFARMHAAAQLGDAVTQLATHTYLHRVIVIRTGSSD